MFEAVLFLQVPGDVVKMQTLGNRHDGTCPLVVQA